MTLVVGALAGTAAVALFTPYGPSRASRLLYFISPYLLRVWTHGRVEFVPSLMVWMLAYAAISGSGYSRQINTSAWRDGPSLPAAFSVALAFAFGQVWQVEGVAAAMLTAECFIALVCAYLAHRSFVLAPSGRGFSS